MMEEVAVREAMEGEVGIMVAVVAVVVGEVLRCEWHVRSVCHTCTVFTPGSLALKKASLRVIKEQRNLLSECRSERKQKERKIRVEAGYCMETQIVSSVKKYIIKSNQEGKGVGQWV